MLVTRAECITADRPDGDLGRSSVDYSSVVDSENLQGHGHG
mgnify:CR=1 FL=1